jgi:glycosyltransferase involved in cell wall biosynthesis
VRTLADTSPWLTVVTVVKDDVPGMAATMGSLVSQDLAGIQYVVIDGSTDRSAVPALLAEGPAADYHWYEPRGIYPAMNTGLAHASGDYVYFANAGDEFLPGVLSHTRSTLVPSSPVWAYGGVDFYAPGQRKAVAEPGWDYTVEIRHFLARRRFPPHQGVFMQTTELRRQGGFDERYRITADYLSILRAGRVAPPLPLGFTVARFTTGGASTTNWREGLREFHRARVDALDLRGLDRWHERWHNAGTWIRTAVYRGLLAR